MRKAKEWQEFNIVSRESVVMQLLRYSENLEKLATELRIQGMQDAASEAVVAAGATYAAMSVLGWSRNYRKWEHLPRMTVDGDISQREVEVQSGRLYDAIQIMRLGGVDTDRIVSVHDHEGWLTVYWSGVPSDKDKHVAGLAWECVGESADLVQHEVEP